MKHEIIISIIYDNYSFRNANATFKEKNNSFTEF